MLLIPGLSLALFIIMTSFTVCFISGLSGLSHSPQALAWGPSASPTLENHLNGFRDSVAVFPKLKLGENEKALCHNNDV